MKKTLFICGYDITLKHITAETSEVLEKAEVVISPSIDKDIILSSRIKIKSVRDLNPERQLSLIKKLFKKYEKIAFLTYGNPCFLNSITYLIKNNLKNIKIITLPAVSSFDIIIDIFNELNLIPKDLTAISLNKDKKKIELYPKTDTIIFGAEALKEDDSLLKQFLLTFKKSYSDDHPIYIVIIKDFSCQDTKIIKTKTNNFETKIKTIKNMATIFIPFAKK